MRDPDMFKYDVRVRERMLRAGRISADEVGRVLDALPDLEASIESVVLNQPALDVAAPIASTTRQSFPPGLAPDEARSEESERGDST